MGSMPLASLVKGILEPLGYMSKCPFSFLIVRPHPSYLTCTFDPIHAFLLFLFVHPQTICRHLNDCFVDDIPVKRRLTRYKHWFQDENIGKRSVIDGTLVVAMFRNPFEWIEAMRARVSDDDFSLRS